MAVLNRVPVRPDGIELIGQLKGSGYRTPPSLVRRPDGQTLQVTPLLYAVLDAIDGRRDTVAIAERVTAETGRAVSASDAEKLIDERLHPMGLVLGADGTAAEVNRSNPLLGLRLKIAITNPVWTRRLTAPFAVLFSPFVWIPLVIVFAGFSWWLLMDHGLAAATYQAFAKPSLLVLVLAITVISAGFHEFGHAAAARRGGAQPGIMGAGIYLLWPAFYTDVTDSYRLGRGGRLRTDLGGLYFNAIVAVGIAAAWWITGWDALLLVIATQILQMVRQLAPLVRFDGYHVLADLIGVPDLFSRIVPILTSFWPSRWHDPRVSQLKWWARLLVTAWVLLVVPILLFTLGTIVLALPRLVGTAMHSFEREQGQMAQLWAAGRGLDAVGAAVAMVAVSVPVLAVVVLLFRVASRGARTVWRRTQGSSWRRGGAMALGIATLAAVAFAWWPNPQRYDPIQPYEGGTLFNILGGRQSAALPVADSGRPTGGQVRTVLPASASLPTEAAPRLALVLVPTPGSGPADTAQPAWVFPFDRPLPPEPGDNQALAVNTTDHSVTYQVAVAMVWVTGDDAALNTNEAYAFASCSDCVTVAVAFQVVAIVGDANVIVPQNLSGALNYNCFDCITAAIASQLVVTVATAPNQEQQIALADLWQQIEAYAATIPTLPLADVLAQLDEYQAEILSILGIPSEPAPSPTPTATDAVDGLAAPSPSDGSTPDVTTNPDSAATAGPTPTDTPTQEPTTATTPEPTPTDSPAPTDSPTPTDSPAPTESPAPTTDSSSEPSPAESYLGGP